MNTRFAVKLEKEIEVTPSFLGLGNDITQCQSVESLKNCYENTYKVTRESCGCLPLSMALKSKVRVFPSINLAIYLLKDMICSTEQEMQCLIELTISNATSSPCLK